MKKLLGCFLGVMLVVFGMSAITIAMPTNPALYDAVCYGDLEGVFAGNDNDYTPPAGATLLTGVEVSDKSFNAVDWGNTQEGYWYADSSTVSFYTIKAGNFYALHSYDPAESLGCWTTDGIIVGSGPQPGGSHISFWGVQSVPEPTTLLLLGTGIFGLAIFGRKRFKH